MVSHKHQCVFIHIPKTAGMSIENTFMKSLGMKFYKGQCPPLLLTYNRNPALGPLSLAHLSINEYLDLHYLNAEQFSIYFKFSVVRNPYDRIVSIYKHFQYHRIISFPTFIKKEFPKLEKEKYYFVKPQSHFLLDDNNKSLVDYIGRFEDLSKVFDAISNHLQYPVGKLEHINSSLKTYNVYSRWNMRYINRVLKNKPYLIPLLNIRNKTSLETSDFFDEDSLGFVNHYYSRDFKCFDYRKISSL